ncbi:hypothetical protein GCM10022243_22330 [Saccharothrix violaceirubra]|uniref:Uncharacterized protein n=1 Tax=Saccharothrix violaceirubra TaxID=413306 RepID=A0A7W7WV88_9PSEU|nr:hypothetical protein [Saccharothrix violaceirubra]MBB4964831.1 hypothetical protein [Saccharothrix violaceirubra]
MEVTTALRLGSGSLLRIPLLVPLTALVLLLLLIPVGPRQVTDSLYRVDTPGFSVSHRDLVCVAEDADHRRCVVDVAGRELSVRSDLEPLGGTCSARFDGRVLSCMKAGHYGPIRPWVLLDGPTLSDVDTAAARASFPWWQALMDSYGLLVVLGVALLLAVTASVLAFLASGRPHPPHPHQAWYALVNGGVVLGLLLVAGAVFRDAGVADALAGPVAPITAPLVVMPIWQWHAGGGGWTRTEHTAVAFLATLVSSVILLGLIGSLAGFPD